MTEEYLTAALTRAAEPAPGGRKTFTFLASSAALDRQGEVVTTDGWDVAAYRRNPVVVDSHNYDSIAHIIGRAVDVRPGDDGLEADIQFNDSPLGRLAEQLVDGGDLRAVSVGFRSIAREIPRDPDQPVAHTAKELLEISAVAIPANPEALRLRGLAAPGDLETRAGRVLSARNETRLRQALTLIGECLDSLGPADAGGGDGPAGMAEAIEPGTVAAREAPDERRELTADVAALLAFIGTKEIN